jgi:hypothetical protein
LCRTAPGPHHARRPESSACGRRPGPGRAQPAPRRHEPGPGPRRGALRARDERHRRRAAHLAAGGVLRVRRVRRAPARPPVRTRRSHRHRRRGARGGPVLAAVRAGHLGVRRAERRGARWDRGDQRAAARCGQAALPGSGRRDDRRVLHGAQPRRHHGRRRHRSAGPGLRRAVGDRSGLVGGPRRDRDSSVARSRPPPWRPGRPYAGRGASRARHAGARVRRTHHPESHGVGARGVLRTAGRRRVRHHRLATADVPRRRAVGRGRRPALRSDLSAQRAPVLPAVRPRGPPAPPERSGGGPGPVRSGRIRRALGRAGHRALASHWPWR